MDKRIVYINNAKDFEKLRELKKVKEIVIVINRDIDFKNIVFTPIDLENSDVKIIGKNKSIKNLIIENDNTPYTGLFSKVGSLSVKSLILSSAIIRGGVLSGSLVGKSEGDLTLSHCKICSIVDAEALCGGVAGCAHDVFLNNTEINTAINGYDIVGGVSAMSETYTEKNSKITYMIASIGKCKDRSVAYCSEREKDRIIRMLYTALEHQPQTPGEEEMEVLKRMLTQNA